MRVQLGVESVSSFAGIRSYALYWSLVNPEALEMMRDANWPASLSLYWARGLIWYWNGTLREMIQALRRGLLNFRGK